MITDGDQDPTGADGTFIRVKTSTRTRINAVKKLVGYISADVVISKAIDLLEAKIKADKPWLCLS